jgi:hypothetical protein
MIVVRERTPIFPSTLRFRFIFLQMGAICNKGGKILAQGGLVSVLSFFFVFFLYTLEKGEKTEEREEEEEEGKKEESR